MTTHNHRVCFADTDAYGVVYFAKYLEWTEAARGEFFRNKIKSMKDLNKQDFLFPVVHAKIDYKKPGTYDDLITIKTTIDKIGNTSIHFNHTIKKDKITLAIVTVVCVCVNQKFEKKTIRKRMKESLLQ